MEAKQEDSETSRACGIILAVCPFIIRSTYGPIFVYLFCSNDYLRNPERSGSLLCYNKRKGLHLVLRSGGADVLDKRKWPLCPCPLAHAETGEN